jgi:hypothetical protein
MASEMGMTIETNAAADRILSQKRLPRGKVITGRPNEVLNTIAKENRLFYWIDHQRHMLQALLNDPDDPNANTPKIVYAPPGTIRPDVRVSPDSEEVKTKYTLIGTPEQIPEGVQFRVLMDSEIQLGHLIKLDMTSIHQLSFLPGKNVPSILDRDGIYVVADLLYTGDTRGNPWYTDVIAVTRPWAQTYGGLVEK